MSVAGIPDWGVRKRRLPVGGDNRATVSVEVIRAVTGVIVKEPANLAPLKAACSDLNFNAVFAIGNICAAGRRGNRQRADAPGYRRRDNSGGCGRRRSAIAR